MISTIRELLKDSNLNIEESNGITVLFQGRSIDYPEDYVEIVRGTNKYLVYEVHRDVKQIKVETHKKEEADVYAMIIYKRLYDDVADRITARSIRNYLNAGKEEKAIEYLSHHFNNLIFSIDKEDSIKISLIKSGDKVDVKYAGEYLVEAAPLNRGYVVLYNYCEKLHHIAIFYDELQKKFNLNLNREKIFSLYILGK